MAINLQKGQRVDIGLQQVKVELSWRPNSNGAGYDYDLDASAFMVGENGKVPADEFLVFYNNQTSPDGAVKSSGDDLTGNDSGETLYIDLSKVDPRVQQIIFTVTIHEAINRRQNFGQVHNSSIAIFDDVSGQEIARYDLDEDFSVETAVEFGRLYRRNGAWKFEALGNGSRGGLEALVNKYVY